jgi:ribosomal protein L21E
MCVIKDLDIVALVEDRETKHFETGEPIKLYKGQVGTIVMEYDGTAFEVEFSNNDGTTYAMETIAAKELILLHHELVQLTA